MHRRGEVSGVRWGAIRADSNERPHRLHRLLLYRVGERVPPSSNQVMNQRLTRKINRSALGLTESASVIYDNYFTYWSATHA